MQKRSASAMVTHPGTTLEVGAVLEGKWVILEFIGKGGMGEVYRAHQLNLKRDVALKIVSREWLRSFDCDSEEIRSSLDRFRREVHVMAQVQHPNVLQIFDHGFITLEIGEEDAPLEYLVMEYVPGATLRSTMSEEGFQPDEELMREWLSDYFLPVLDGIQALHEAGVVHRDLKPENILISGKTPKIADFGLARSCALKPITRSADVMGTPPYMSPEHFMDLRRTDERADIYSLGKILFEAASGKFGSTGIPFKQSKLQNPKTPFYRELDRIIQQATAEERKERFPSVMELKGALEDVLREGEEQPHTPEGGKAGGAHPVKAGPVGSAPVEAGPARIKEAPYWRGPLAAALALILIGLIALGVISYLQHSHPPVQTEASTPPAREPHVPGEPDAPFSASSQSLPATLQGSDEAVLHLVPGGEITVPDHFEYKGGERVQPDPFYMDETPVTNHQYVKFLNSVAENITMENGVVRREGEIWLMLGEVIRGYEPIVFRDGRYHVKEAHHAACPVVRVTAFGAAAYARHYGRRLPTEVEWIRALGPGDSPSGKPRDKTEAALPVPTPVLMFKPNAFGIREINANIGEWGSRSVDGASFKEGRKEVEYVVLGGTSKKLDSKFDIPAPIRRYPWEAFGEVGFRCVRDVPK